MKVTCHYRNDPERKLTDPLPEIGGRKFIFRLYSGDVCDPVNGNWFKEPFPTKVIRFFCKWPVLPFIAWKWPFVKKAGYIGAKLYGADPVAYKNWMPETDVYPGSQAVCFSIRPFASLENK